MADFILNRKISVDKYPFPEGALKIYGDGKFYNGFAIVKINEKLKADTNLKDTIKDIHDNVAQEMYCRGIDDLTEKLKDYFVIPHDARVIEMTAEQLKEQNK